MGQADTMWTGIFTQLVPVRVTNASPNNYRPAHFILGLCCKILGHIICIFQHLNQANILYEEQHGFKLREAIPVPESHLPMIVTFAQCLNIKV